METAMTLGYNATRPANRSYRAGMRRILRAIESVPGKLHIFPGLDGEEDNAYYEPNYAFVAEKAARASRRRAKARAK
jgi:hypothetical protein